MRAAVMMKRIAEASPSLKARIAGALFLLLVLTAACTEFFFHGRLSVAADLAAGIIEVSCMIAVTLLFYDIFKPVNRLLSLLAASFNFMAVTLELLRSQAAAQFDHAALFRRAQLHRRLAVRKNVGSRQESIARLVFLWCVPRGTSAEQ